jgi:hypothetical protein
VITILVSLTLQCINYLTTLLVKRKDAPLLRLGRPSARGIRFEGFDLALEQNRPREPTQSAAYEV